MGKTVGNFSRRKFILGAGALLFLAPLLAACRQKATALLVKLTGTNHILGHRLWAKNFPATTKTLETHCLIIGGGISGLSAARQLRKKSIDDFFIVELEGHTGGNSSSRENKYSKYPLGAHYLPLPNFHDKELLDFLEEEKIIIGYDTPGMPVFDERQLTFSPQERLFYKNLWQEGLVPKFGNSNATEIEFNLFFEKMDGFRKAKGKDGKYCFDIPLTAVSSDGQFQHFDTITMKQWLDDNAFTTTEVREYINYCCRDDFGLGIDYVSAWAGIHYFAARKHSAAGKDNVLTWPEGNARLASHLKKYAEGKILKQHIAYDIAVGTDAVKVKVFDAATNTSTTITAKKVIVAAPQFVNQYLFPQRKELSSHFNYAPWVLATVTVNGLPADVNYPLSWDNVIYGARGLGYIYNQHQNLNQIEDRQVITYYHSISSANLKEARHKLYKSSKEYWKQFVIADLAIAHPGIESLIEEIDIQVLGHGMVSPVPGFIFGEAKRQATQSIGNKVFFAHSDLSGISIFEEAFHQGINAINSLTDETALDT